MPRPGSCPAWSRSGSPWPVPRVGLVLGGALVLLRPDEDPPGLVGFALRAAIFTTLGWSLFNLLPIVPLDGGQALRELLPGNPVARAKRAAVVSIILAVVLAAVAVQNRWIGTFGLVLAAFLVLANVMQLRGLAAAGRPPAVGSGDGDGEENEILRLLWEGRPAQARAVLERRAQFEDPSGADADLALHGAVLATTGEREQGFALLYQEWSRRGGDQHVTGLIALRTCCSGSGRTSPGCSPGRPRPWCLCPSWCGRSRPPGRAGTRRGPARSRTRRDARGCCRRPGGEPRRAGVPILNVIERSRYGCHASRPAA